MQYAIKQFKIENLKGISDKNTEEHLKLYAGYVNNFNNIQAKIEELKKDEKNSYIVAELQRRASFEFCGMRNHEYYFESLAGGAKNLAENSKLKNKIEKDFDSFDLWLASFKNLALTRGIGWATLYYDKQADKLLHFWVDEQHLGHPTGLAPILLLDMWEHSFVFDFQPSGKKAYVEAFFENLNWSKIEENFN